MTGSSLITMRVCPSCGAEPSARETRQVFLPTGRPSASAFDLFMVYVEAFVCDCGTIFEKTESL